MGELQVRRLHGPSWPGKLLKVLLRSVLWKDTLHQHYQISNPQSFQHMPQARNTALITPIHKKGCTGDPNNYWAITVDSNLGKLFLGILLDRLMTFRTTFCPDTVNQLGFVKDVQTSEDTFALRTWISQYAWKIGKFRTHEYQKIWHTKS